jgi:dTDP-4-amino-4,6-dideoxy-D-galactose acyltransferase
MIRKLEWDSDFFSLNVGEWQESPGRDADFDVVYLKSGNGTAPEIEGYENTFGETRVVFAKKLTEQPKDEGHIRKAIGTDDKETLYDLAYESGKYSRFRLDGRFGIHNFEKLYRAWIDNSLDGTFADEVLIYDECGTVYGLVTYKKQGNEAVIGLIATSPEKQGKGIGKRLLEAVEQRLVKDGIYQLKIPTQLENEAACSFYKKQGYSIVETTYLMHYWKQ